MKWYEMSEEQRVKEIYSKYTIKDFWNWWSSREPRVMEVRIKDYITIKEIASKYKIPYSPSGVYVSNEKELKAVISSIRAKENITAWFGIQPRKKNWNKWGGKSFGGKDVNVDEINFLFIDIDRVNTGDAASSKDLKNADELANNILERLGTQGWNKSYIKICSGHGVQLLVKLDYSLTLPTVVFESKTKTFVMNDEFEQMKKIITKGIGAQILKFCNKYKDDLKVICDKNVFKLSVVGALHCTKNFKYNTSRWRGIIELRDDENTGLTDYIMSKDENEEQFNSKNIFIRASGSPKARVKGGNIRSHRLVKFMLEHDLPEGMRNNYLWFQLKCILRDNKIDLNSKSFRKLHAELEKKHGALPLNLPDKKFKFDENIVNSFCIQNLIPPIYEMWPKRGKHIIVYGNFNWELYINHYDDIVNSMKLDNDTEIIEDMKKFKQVIYDECVYNHEHSDPEIKVKMISSFIKGCIKKYGEEKTKFYEKYIFERFFDYD